MKNKIITLFIVFLIFVIPFSIVYGNGSDDECAPPPPGPGSPGNIFWGQVLFFA
jgi:hypothetical protein